MFVSSLTHSQYGHLVTGSFSDLARQARALRKMISESVNRTSFVDAYDYECSRNRTADNQKRLRDVEAEINARMLRPEASANVERLRNTPNPWAAHRVTVRDVFAKPTNWMK